MTGYRNALYAESLAEFGTLLELPGSRGWLLERPISSSTRRDAMGCYPLFSCCDWSKLRDDIDSLADRLLTLALVVDPFAPLMANELRRCFDVVKPFKEHLVVDVTEPIEKQVSKHHRYYARKALQQLRVEVAVDPVSHLDEWMGLYGTLVVRHNLRGIKAFSRNSFAVQLRVPGLIMFRALGHVDAVGAHLWFLQDGVAYSHLSAFNDTGYRTSAAYALCWEAIRTFREQMSDYVRWIDLGAGAGIGAGAADGLTRFKRGWANTTRTKYFCGRIFDRQAYAELATAKGVSGSNYFPAYRMGEF